MKISILSNSGGVTLLGAEVERAAADSAEFGCFEIAIDSQHFGDEDLFDADFETASYRLTGIALSRRKIRAVADMFKNRPLGQIRGVFDLGRVGAPTLALEFSDFALERSNPEKAQLQVTVGGFGAAQFSVSFVVDPTCLTDFVQ